jgi:hypothetical protein
VSKIIKLEVSRKEYTELYVEVPDDFTNFDVYKLHVSAAQFVEEQVRPHDWEQEPEIEVEGSKFVEAAEVQGERISKWEPEKT